MAHVVARCCDMAAGSVVLPIVVATMNDAARKSTPTPAQMIAGAKASAIIDGCTCDPLVVLRELSPGLFSAEVRHDDRCGHASQQKGRDA